MTCKDFGGPLGKTSKKNSKKSDIVTKGRYVGSRPKTTFYLKSKIVTWGAGTKVNFVM